MAYKRRKKMNRFITFSMVLIIAGICTVLYYNFLEMEKEKAVATQKLNDVEEEYEDEVERSKQLKDYKAYVQTKQFAEEVARKKFGLAYEDEIIFKVSDGEEVYSDIVEKYDEQAAKEEEKKKQEQAALEAGQAIQ